MLSGPARLRDCKLSHCAMMSLTARFALHGRPCIWSSTALSWAGNFAGNNSRASRVLIAWSPERGCEGDGASSYDIFVACSNGR